MRIISLIDIIENLKTSGVININLVGNFDIIQDKNNFYKYINSLKYNVRLFSLFNEIDHKILINGNNSNLFKILVPVSKLSDDYNIEAFIKAKFELIFIITNEEEYKIASSLMESNNYSKFSFVPYFDGTNLEFFEEHIYLDKMSFQDIAIKRNELDSRNFVNSNYFGQLVINQELNVSSSLHSKPIVNLKHNSIAEAIIKETTNKSSLWYEIRKNIKPCSECVYSIVCPPLSNYELYFSKNNLCNIKP